MEESKGKTTPSRVMWWGPPEITLIEHLLSVCPTSFGEHNEILSTLRLKSLLACKQLSWPGKVWVCASQCNVSESCLLSASCGLSCYLTVRLIPHTQPHHSHILKNYSEFFWNKNYNCEEFYYLKTWAFINLLIPGCSDFSFQTVKRYIFHTGILSFVFEHQLWEHQEFVSWWCWGL